MEEAKSIIRKQQQQRKLSIEGRWRVGRNGKGSKGGITDVRSSFFRVGVASLFFV
jgi:hypothetical protein